MAVAIPAFNEEGIVGFLKDIDAALAGRTVSLHIVDDCSTIPMVQDIEASTDALAAEVDVSVNQRNSGHGPTVVAAYRRALESGADCVMQVDGDGQFDADDLRKLLSAIEGGADIAVGVRQGRVDPWFRKALTRLVRLHVALLFGLRSPDPNCPFRAYTREALTALLAELPPEPLVPTIYLSALASRRKYEVAHIEVAHRVRRGDSEQGSMWGKGNRKILIPRRLLKFVGRAFSESIRFAWALRRSS